MKLLQHEAAMTSSTANDNKNASIETEFVMNAMARVEDPYRRYVFSMLIDLLADVINSADKEAIKKLIEIGGALTK
jgi:hypothetical protein